MVATTAGPGARAATPAARTATTRPVVAPPRTAPMTYHEAVPAKRRPRPRSASGVMDDSIDSPHGDQEERTAAATAVTRARGTSNVMGSTSPGWTATPAPYRVAGPDRPRSEPRRFEDRSKLRPAWGPPKAGRG